MKQQFLCNKNKMLCAILAVFSGQSFAEELPQVDIPEVKVVGNAPSSNWRLQPGAKDYLTDGEVLTTNDLKTKRAVSLGQTVEQVSGVQNNAYGPNTGVPQIRSLSGSRVYVSENGLGISDAASVSPDLPLMVNPFMAEKITVLKSSAAVLYGGNAIGGAVDVDTGVIATEVPEKDLNGKVEVSGGYNTPRVTAFKLNGKVGNVAWHLSGADTNANDYRIPGDSKPAACYDHANIYSSRLMWACQVTPDITETLNKGYYRYVAKDIPAFIELWKRYNDGSEPDESELYKLNKPFWGDWVENPLYDGSPNFRNKVINAMKDDMPVEKGRLKNSHLSNQNFAFGLSHIGERSYAGVSVSRFLSKSGIAGFGYYNFAESGHHHGGTHKAPAREYASVRAQQTRWQAEAMYRPLTPWIENIKFQAAYTQNPTSEYLGDTKMQTLDSKTFQSRLEFNHKAGSWLKGTLGADWKQRSTESSGINGKRTGNYAYLPDTDSKEYGIFALENFKWKNWNASLGWRHGEVRHSVDIGDYKPGRNSSTVKGLEERGRLKYSLNHYHAGLGVDLFDFLKLGARYSRSQRAPEVNELYAGGDHYALMASESHWGVDVLRPETAGTWEVNGEIGWKDGRFRASWYKTQFKDYTFLVDAAHDGGQRLPTKYWRSGDTQLHGVELEVNQWFDLNKYGTLEARLFGDFVHNRADLDDERNSTLGNGNRVRNNGYYMPNMPVSRYGAGLTWNKGNWQLGTSLTRYRPAKHTGHMAANYKEPVLGGYTMWDMYMSHTTKHGKSTAEWFLDARNLANRTARPQNSMLKYIAPLPGRSVRAGVRLTF